MRAGSPAPVDFSDLRTEYIGIVYEGLLDYELRRAAADDPIVFLNVGRQPALPLSRLDELTAAERKKLLKTFKKDAASDVETESDEERRSRRRSRRARRPRTTMLGEAEDALDAERRGVGRRGRDRGRPPLGARGRRRRRPGSPAARRDRPTRRSFERRIDDEARKLVAGVIPPGRLYLVASGGLRKGSGSFYTRPALAVPLVQRTLEPLCYEREGDELVPRLPEEILALKVCEPAMGSGSFLVGALRYLVDALVASFEHHGRIQRRSERETIVTLPFGVGATGEENEEIFDLPPEDERFLERLRPRLARHVVERCLYGVDRNPMAVELARLALWVETLDRELPFEYLDHKLKVGNSLVGCWLHLVDDYPLRALDREGGDGPKGERTKWLKARLAAGEAGDARRDPRAGRRDDALRRTRAPGGGRRRPGARALRATPRPPAGAPRGRLPRAARERGVPAAEGAHGPLVRALVLAPGRRRRCRRRAPGPSSTTKPLQTLDRVVAEQRFFHWEIEFPDVFGPERAGFDAVLGNPPWETVQLEPAEFFSRVDPLYRTYGKTEALEGRATALRRDPQPRGAMEGS